MADFYHGPDLVVFPEMFRSFAISFLCTTACASGATSAPPATAQAPGVVPTVAPPATPRESPPPAARKICNASVSLELQQALSARAAKSRVCYEHLLREDPTLAGAALVAVRMSGQGNFDEANLIKDEIGNPTFAQCILSNFREPTGTLIEGDCVEVNIPLRFVPKNAPPAGAAPGSPG